MPRHSWPERLVERFHNDRGENTKTERQCERCGLVKVTFHAPGPPYHWTEFWRAGEKTDDGGFTPPCTATEATAKTSRT